MEELLLVLLGVVVLVAPWIGVALHVGTARRLRTMEARVARLEGERAATAGARAVVEGGEAATATGAAAGTGTAAGTAAGTETETESETEAEPEAESEAGTAPRPETATAGLAADAAPRVDDAPARRASLEDFLGGRVLLVVGVVVVLFGLAFFLKVAWERGWLGALGPGLRIGLGAAAGVVLLVVGDRLRGRDLAVFGHALMGGGLGALYLSNYFASVWYGFFGQQTAFALVAGVTALGAALAVWRDAKLLAWLGFLGAFLAPALLGRDEDALEALTLWLVVVDVGLLAVLAFRRWRGLEVLALAASTLYFGLWYERWFPATGGTTTGEWQVPLAGDRASAAAWCLAALLAAQLVLHLLPAGRRRDALPQETLLSVVAAGLLALWGGAALLLPDARASFAAAILATGVAYAAGARWIAARRGSGGPDTETLDVLAVVSLAVAIPVRLEGAALAPAWSAAGLAVLFAGRRLPRLAFTATGCTMVVLAIAHVLLDRMPLHDAAFRPFANGAFLSAVTPAVACLLGAAVVRRVGREAAAPLRAGLAIVGTWFLALLLAIELHDLASLDPDRFGERARELALVFPAIGLALQAVVFAALLGRGPHAVPATPVGPAIAALLLALLANTVGPRPEFTPVLNAAFGAAALAVVAAGVVARLVRDGARVVAAAGALVGVLAFVTSEIHATGRLSPLDGGTRAEALFVAQVWISVAWGLYGAALLVVGFRRDVAALRWSGLAVFALTLGKIVTFDMAELDTVYRIGSFLGVGGLLVAASFLYQRSRGDRQRPSDGGPGVGGDGQRPSGDGPGAGVTGRPSTGAG